MHDLLQSGNGLLFAAVEGPLGGQVLRSDNGGASWTPAAGMDGVKRAYALAEADGVLYVGVNGGDSAVYQWTLDGQTWSPSPGLPGDGVEAVQTLLRGPTGEVLAGVEMTVGLGETQVLVKEHAQASWQLFGGNIDLARTVYTLAGSEDSVFAGTGVYGHVYAVNWPPHAPVIDQVTPNLGSNAAALLVDITGSRFTAQTTASLGTTPPTALAVQFISATSLRVTVPANLPPGVYDVTLTNPTGGPTTKSAAYTVVEDTPVINCYLPIIMAR